MVTLKNPFIRTETEGATFLRSKKVQCPIYSNSNQYNAISVQGGLVLSLGLTEYVFRTKKGEEIFTRNEAPADDLQVGEGVNLERKYLNLGIIKIEIGKKVRKI